MSEDSGKKERILEKIKEKALRGRLSCPTARLIAEELGVSYREVGEAANQLKVKITNCDLGCF
jgi:hypothetical protein